MHVAGRVKTRVESYSQCRHVEQAFSSTWFLRKMAGYS